jgi:hypothetical protein
MSMIVGAIVGGAAALVATLIRDRAWHWDLAIYRCTKCGFSPQRVDKKPGPRSQTR